jgi:photosystem II stability/assembly factor-like uncharacterized protein
MQRGRTRLALLAVAVIAVGAAATVALAGSSSSPKRLPLRLVPNAVAFLDPSHGVLGTGWQYRAGYGGGTIALTADGGRTWQVVKLTPRPVVSLTVSGNAYLARYDDGETLQSRDGRTWRPTPLATAGINTEFSVCPQGASVGTNSGDLNWSLCTTEPGAGNQGKAVYRNLPDRGWVRVACTNFANLKGVCAGRGHGGISSYGYPIGIAGAPDGRFGLIWESRGTLYVTRDGGRNWTALAKLVQPEIDFGSWAFTLRGGVGWALVGHGGGPWRLLRTTDAGRSWGVVHRWAAPKR